MSKVFLILAILAAGAASYFAFENKNAYTEVLEENKEVEEQLAKLKRDNSTEIGKIDNAKAELAAAEESRNEAEARATLKRENVSKRDAALNSTRNELQGVNQEIAVLESDLQKLNLPSAEALTVELEEASAKKVEMEAEIEEQTVLAESLRTALNGKRGVLSSLKRSVAERAASLGVKSRRARISAVDPEWGFAVINTSNTAGINAKDRVIVERGGQRVGMLVVERVERSKIVANLVPEAGPGVQPGDTVIFQQKSEG